MSEDGRAGKEKELPSSSLAWDSWALEAEAGVRTPVPWEATRSRPVHDAEWFLVAMYVVCRSRSRHEVLCINKW